MFTIEKSKSNQWYLKGKNVVNWLGMIIFQPMFATGVGITYEIHNKDGHGKRSQHM